MAPLDDLLQTQTVFIFVILCAQLNSTLNYVLCCSSFDHMKSNSHKQFILIMNSQVMTIYTDYEFLVNGESTGKAGTLYAGRLLL